VCSQVPFAVRARFRLGLDGLREVEIGSETFSVDVSIDSSRLSNDIEAEDDIFDEFE
jgi:hypothetical protein